jgi:UDP-N-acetylmuramyl pentapeptide phosphotransferase/UDP-N-acetylglucosamine-1-phosphate transferase
MVLSFLVALVLSAGLTPLARWLGERGGWFRRPGGRHIHTRPIARTGGLALALAVTAALVLVLVLPIPRPAGETVRVGLLIVGPLLGFALVLRDDIREMPAGTKLLIQCGVAALAIVPWFLAPDLQPPPGLLINQVQTPFWGTVSLPVVVAVLFTLFWIVGMMNTVNLLDGLDGLAGGVTAIAALLLFVHTVRLGQYSLAPLPLAVAGACLGFLPYNFHPARVFMGDSGALYLGYSMAILSIIGGAKIATALLVLGVPILDVAWVLIFRLTRGRSPLQADRGHLHHRLLDLGLSQVQVVGLFYGLSAGFGLLALLLPTPLFKFIALAVMGVGIGSLLWWLARRELDRGQATGSRKQEQKGEDGEAGATGW